MPDNAETRKHKNNYFPSLFLRDKAAIINYRKAVFSNQARLARHYSCNLGQG